jgi:hypothetical protein
MARENPGLCAIGDKRSQARRRRRKPTLDDRPDALTPWSIKVGARDRAGASPGMDGHVDRLDVGVR